MFSGDTAGMRKKYLMIEGWLDLGNFEEADLEFRKLPARSILTTRGLCLWLRLSWGLERWAEALEATKLLQAKIPDRTAPLLSQMAALQQQVHGTLALRQITAQHLVKAERNQMALN